MITKDFPSPQKAAIVDALKNLQQMIMKDPPPPPQIKPEIVDALKMISSPYCAVSEPNVYKHYKWFTRGNANANRCYLFTAVKVFIM